MRRKTLLLSVLFMFIGIFWFVSNLIPDFKDMDLGENDE